MGKLSHVDEQGRASMVDVSGKKPVLRIARASGRILVSQETAELIAANEIKKGDVLGAAEIAGIQAAKQTSNLIPLCHPLRLTKIDVKAQLAGGAVEVTGTVRCMDRTGVEMEALTAVSVALLTVYDMCKAVDKKMRITDVVLEEKVKHEV